MQIEQVQEATDFIRQRISSIPSLAVILGSGLGEYADSLQIPQIIPYAEIPHFPHATVASHKGQLVFSAEEQLPFVVMQGRFHYYEGYSLEQVTFPIRVLGMLGVRRLIVTNAAGGINPHFAAGDFMLIRDHINLMGVNPLRGPHNETFGARFSDMSDAYHCADRAVFTAVAQQLGISLKEGIYVGLSGPSFETPAEIRMLERLGADAVGMSTVPEVIVANQMGMHVSGLSCITNMAAGRSPVKLSHQDVMETADRVRQQFIALLDGTIRQFCGQTTSASHSIPSTPYQNHEALIRAAAEARLRAYAPYSNFLVGAAVITQAGKIFSGCNIENSSYGATRCAEQVALLQAYAAGTRDIAVMAIVTDTSPPTPPCGICRQIINELAGNVEIILANLAGEVRHFRAAELFPEAFNKKFLT